MLDLEMMHRWVKRYMYSYDAGSENGVYEMISRIYIVMCAFIVIVLHGIEKLIA